MGYNGGNRRLKGSVIRKSSLNFGTRLVSSIIATPIAAALEIASTKISNRTTNNRSIISTPSIRCAENSIKIPVESMDLMTSSKYRHIVAGLDDLLNKNESLEKLIILKNSDLRKLNIKKMLFILFPVRKKKIVLDIYNLKNEIEGLCKRKEKEVLDVRELVDIKREELLSSLKKHLMSSKLLISNESCSYFDSQRVYNSFILNRVKAQISFNPNTYINYCPALTISAPNIDLFFLGEGIVVKGNGKFAIIDYENLNPIYQEVRVKENEYFDTEGYILDSYTFLHSRNDGGADLRYSYNPTIPIIKYGNLSLKMNEDLTLNLFFNNYTVGLKLYEVINNNSYCTNDRGVRKMSYQTTIKERDYYEFNTAVNSFNLWNGDMNKLLANADSLVLNKKNKEAVALYNELIDIAMLKNNSIYKNIAFSRLKELEDGKIDTTINASCSWDNEMHNLLANADSLMNDEKYEDAEIQFTKLLDVAKLHNFHLYTYIATERLKELKNKMDLLKSCNPNALFHIEMINKIIEDAKSYEAVKDYKKALSRYIEVKMYGIMYSSLPYIDLAKVKIEKLKNLK